MFSFAIEAAEADAACAESIFERAASKRDPFLTYFKCKFTIAELLLLLSTANRPSEMCAM